MTVPPFACCPRCGTRGLSFDGKNRYSCGSCGFVFFQNTAAACGAILTVRSGPDAGRIVLLCRGEEPAKGLFDYPGGFVDPGESAEDALAREIREEINCAATNLRFLCSRPNRYRYRDVEYATCDLIFTGDLESTPSWFQSDEIAGIRVVDPRDINLDQIAFASLRAGLETFLRTGAGAESAHSE